LKLATNLVCTNSFSIIGTPRYSFFQLVSSISLKSCLSWAVAFKLKAITSKLNSKIFLLYNGNDYGAKGFGLAQLDNLEDFI